MLARLVSPSVVPGYLATILGVSPSVAKVGMAALSALAPAPVASATAVDVPVTDRVIGTIRSLLAMGDEVAAGLITGFVENHERSAELTELLSAISHLPLKHFEGEHADLRAFVREGLLPFLHVIADPACPHCSEASPAALQTAGDATVCATCDNIF